MSDEPEYYSIHDQMRDLAMNTEKKIVEQPKANDLDDIRKSLKYILDKMTNMDRFIRSSHFRDGGQILDGEAYRTQVIEKFLTNLRDNVATPEEKEMFRGILSQKPKVKEIDKDVL